MKTSTFGRRLKLDTKLKIGRIDNRAILKLVGSLIQLAVVKNNNKNGRGIDIIPNEVGGWIRHLAKV